MENWRKFLKEAAGPETTKKIQDAIIQAGGEPFIVGGAVRDSFIEGTPESKDIDFIVTGLPLDEIEEVLSPLGSVSQVGKSFGVVIANVDGEDFDIAIPRTGEKKTGPGHADFEITTDPNAPVGADLGRRDFTMNGLAKDAQGNIIDEFGGLEDIKNKVIRAIGNPEDRFREDPLRMLRALQFATRFGFTIEPATAAAIKKQASSFKTISPERILKEFEKAWTKGNRDTPLFIKLLKDTGVGRVLFGNDFNPVAVPLSREGKDLTNGNFMAFFLNGGNSAALMPTNEMKTYLQLAKTAMEDRLQPWEYIKNHRDKLPLIIEVLRSVDRDVAAKLEQAQELPLSPKELAIDARYLMGVGIQGPAIGQTQRKILQAIHSGEIQNDVEQIKAFVGKSR